MGARENPAQREAWLEFGRQGSKMFRLNSGTAWAGKGQRQPDGTVLIAYAQPVTLGFGYPNNKPVAGASDLIGWTPVVITPEMVGQTVAVFTAGEAKPATGGKASEDQEKFIAAVRRDGGIAGVVRGALDVLLLKNEWFARHKS